MSVAWVLGSLAFVASSVALGAEAPSPHHHADKKPELAGRSLAGTTPFSSDTEGLPEAKPSETVELADGASYTLVAAPVRQRIAGQWLRRLAYNGSVPGPFIKVAQGATVRITLRNATDAETTLHPHGLRGDDRNDGVVGIGQAAIAPGQSHEYTLKFVDAGVFWYHPHVRDDYGQEMGLYGNFIVTPRSSTFYNPVHREIPLVIDDVGVSDKNPFYKDRVTHTLMGRYGDVMLVNGVDDFRIKGTASEVLRLFITNTANTRTFALAIPGIRLKLVGSDNGLYERETWVERVIIAPSERYIVEMKLPAAGVYDVINDKPTGAAKLARLEVVDGKMQDIKGFDELRTPAAAAAELQGVKAKLTLPVQKVLRLSVAMDHRSLPMAHDHPPSGAKQAEGAAKSTALSIEWDDQMPEMNRASDDKNVTWKLIDENTKQENMDIDWIFKRGDFVKIRLINDESSMHPMQHPIHFHGQRFVVAAVDGTPNSNLAWKDSVLVAGGETVDIVLEASQVGRWMAHCHIAEHLGAGMMIGFQVKP